MAILTVLISILTRDSQGQFPARQGYSHRYGLPCHSTFSRRRIHPRKAIPLPKGVDARPLHAPPVFSLPILLLLLFVAASASAQAQPAPNFPDAPLPTAAIAKALPLLQPIQTEQQDSQNPPTVANPKAASPIEHAPFEQRKWSQYVDPGERIPPLYPKDKWMFWLHQEARAESALPAVLSAGYGQLTDTPDYGSDEEAFGDRLGAAVLRQASMRFFCNSFVPVILHEDPRYFRKASGSYKGRAGWAAERAFVIQHDNGSHGFNNSDLFGHLAASALTPLYYPHPSANFEVVMQTWGTSIAGDIGNNMLLEFWPDVTNLWRRHRQKEHAVRSSER